jgi:cytochrome c
MINRVSKWLMAVAGFLFCMQAMAAETPANAQALVAKAVAFIKANGKDKALAEFNNPKGAFVKGELYVFVLDKDGVTLANGVNPKIVGKTVMDMKDTTGKYFIKDMFAVAAAKGAGWVDYQWPDPVSNIVRAKSTYVEKSGDWLVCVGIYK